eukprot:COSAG02_NODE_1874_length_10576_cov_8.410614_3_plen_94_part_00
MYRYEYRYIRTCVHGSANGTFMLYTATGAPGGGAHLLHIAGSQKVSAGMFLSCAERHGLAMEVLTCCCRGCCAPTLWTREQKTREQVEDIEVL